MTKLKKRISVILFAASVLGLLLSMMHYHSASLDCLEHAGEPHYTEYEWVCPVCALQVQLDSDDTSTFHAFLEFKEYVTSSVEPLPLQEAFDSPLGRSPPAIA